MEYSYPALFFKRTFIIGCYDGRDNLTHYRIDRMTDVEVLHESAHPVWSLPAYRDRSFDAALYAQEHHFMFGGEPRTVVLKMSRSCAGDVLDAFGSRASMALTRPSLADCTNISARRRVGFV